MMSLAQADLDAREVVAGVGLGQARGLGAPDGLGEGDARRRSASEIESSLAPCAIASTLTLTAPSAPKSLPEIPGVPAIPYPTIVAIAISGAVAIRSSATRATPGIPA